MDLYTDTSYELSKRLTQRYSTSFSLASSLFDQTIQNDIYAIYGMVRIADEIVDTYRGNDAASQLTSFEQQVVAALKTGYSTNPILHAFASTARTYGITQTLITPFFASMHADLTEKQFSQKAYDNYIYGSAEVVGLMCLKVFVRGDKNEYEHLKPGAQALGAAYQKVNFLRDMHADYTQLGRVYFPGVEYETFDEKVKASIEADIRADFEKAAAYIDALPRSARRAVHVSYAYYLSLLNKIEKTPAATLLQRRMSVPAVQKLLIIGKAKVGL